MKIHLTAGPPALPPGIKLTVDAQAHEASLVPHVVDKMAREMKHEIRNARKPLQVPTRDDLPPFRAHGRTTRMLLRALGEESNWTVVFARTYDYAWQLCDKATEMADALGMKINRIAQNRLELDSPNFGGRRIITFTQFDEGQRARHSYPPGTVFMMDHDAVGPIGGPGLTPWK